MSRDEESSSTSSLRGPFVVLLVLMLFQLTATAATSGSIDPAVDVQNVSSDGNDTVTEWDVDAYLASHWGPKHLPIDVVVPITVVYVVIFVSGVVGNVAVCAVIIRNPAMHTATNCYLFSLAVSDLTVLLFGLPNDLSVYWQQYPWAWGEIVCRLRALIAEMTNYASVLTIVAFSLERYLAICHPLHAYRMAGLGRAAKIVALIWTVAFASALPFAIYTTIAYAVYPEEAGPDLVGLSIPESAFCAMLEENQPTHWPLVEMATFIFFIVPMGILCLLYLRIGIRIRRTSLGRGCNAHAGAVHHSNESQRSSSRRNILRMLVAVVIGFFVCWAPFHSQRLLYVYAKDNPNFREINEKMFFITGCFYYFSSTINPILYNVMSKRYREAFRETLCGYSTGRSRNHRQNSEQVSRLSRNGTVSHVSTAVMERRSLALHNASLHAGHNGSSPVAKAEVSPVPEDKVLATTSADSDRNVPDVDQTMAAVGRGAHHHHHHPHPLSVSGTGQSSSAGKRVVEWRLVSPLHAAAHSRGVVGTAATASASMSTTSTTGNGGAGSLPAGCTPSCLKSSQLVRRASEASPPPSADAVIQDIQDEATNKPPPPPPPSTGPVIDSDVIHEGCPLLPPSSDSSAAQHSDPIKSDTS